MENVVTEITQNNFQAAATLQKAEQQWESACSSLNQAETQLEDVRNTWEFKTEQALEVIWNLYLRSIPFISLWVV